jgi:hypothetical protein
VDGPLRYTAPVLCGGVDARKVDVERSAELELPQPTLDPMNLVVGSGTETVTDGPCVIPPSNYLLRFERTGD